MKASLEKQLAAIRATPARNARQARSKRLACERVEVRMRSKWKPDPNYRDPF